MNEDDFLVESVQPALQIVGRDVVSPEVELGGAPIVGAVSNQDEPKLRFNLGRNGFKFGP